jgi:hypothetical protein
MSEAFANRHHHCERVDPLNRGIWTSHGIGGTADNPTGPAVEMYLRCNHDGCARIDWRTVHGLQCHIVKNHEQPKGTIGSLEKALERYGVPVKEVEDYEREHGKGTAGTMADPKNLKMKLKTKIRDFSRKGTPGSYGVDPDARPAGYRPSPADDSPSTSDGIKRSPDGGAGNGYFRTTSAAEDASKQSAPHTASASPVNGFTAVRSNWAGVPPTVPPPAKAEPEVKNQQTESSPSAAAQNGHNYTSQVNGSILTTPPSTVTVAPPQPATAAAATSAPVSSINLQPPVTASSSTPAPPTLQIEKEEPVKDVVQQNGENVQSDHAAPTAAKDEDVEMTGTREEAAQADPPNGVNGETVTESKEQPEIITQPESASVEEQSETIEVDGNAGKDIGAPVTRRSNFQSPTITTRSLAATTPASAKRPSRRSSVARKSVDVDGDSVKASDDGDRDEKDIKDEKPEPRRSLTGRVLRRGTRSGGGL